MQQIVAASPGGRPLPHEFGSGTTGEGPPWATERVGACGAASTIRTSSVPSRENQGCRRTMGASSLCLLLRLVSAPSFGYSLCFNQSARIFLAHFSCRAEDIGPAQSW